MSMNITRNQIPAFSANYYLKTDTTKENKLAQNDITTAKEEIVKRCKNMQSDIMIEKCLGQIKKKNNPGLPDLVFPGFKFKEVKDGVKISITHKKAKSSEGAKDVEVGIVNKITTDLIPHRYLEDNIFKQGFDPLKNKTYEVPVQAPSLQFRAPSGKFVMTNGWSC